MESLENWVSHQEDVLQDVENNKHTNLAHVIVGVQWTYEGVMRRKG